MSMDRGFQKWLAKRGIQPETIAILQIESIFHENTLKLLRQADLELLRTKHHITMGQFALLRTAHGDLLATDEDGFEMIGMEDVPAGLGGGGGDQQQAPADRTRKNSRGEKYKVHDKRQQSTKDLLSDNLEKVAYREMRLQSAAETAERVVSSAEEYNRLASMLAEKKRRASGKGFFRPGQRTSSSSSVDTGSRTSGKRSSSTLPPDTYDHLDALSPPPPQPSHPVGKNHEQLEPGSDDVSGSSGAWKRRGKDDRNGYRQPHQNDTAEADREDHDGTTNCCTIL